MDADLSVADVAKVFCQQMPTGAVRKQWIQKALGLLVEIGWAVRVDGDRYHLRFTRPKSMGKAEVFFMNQLARRRAQKRLMQDEKKPAQLSLGIDVPTAPE
jgi:hypothetical protein